MDKLYYFDEFPEEGKSNWTPIKAGHEFISHIVDHLGLKRADTTINAGDSSIVDILKAWKDQKNEEGAITLLEKLDEQGMLFLSIDPANQEIEA